MGQASRDADGPAPSRPEPTTARDGEELRRRLRRIRAWTWGALVTHRIAVVVGWAVMALVVGAALDYFLRAPTALRALGLVGAVAVLLWVVRWFVRPAVLFRPSLTELALRLERSAPDGGAALRDVLAAGLELSSVQTTAGNAELARPVVAAAAARAAGLAPARLLAPGRVLRSLAWATLSVGLFLSIAATAPDLARTGLARMLWPWGSAQWPKRTGIVDATGEKVHPLGTALALRAALIRRAGGAEALRVAAKYRIITGGTPGPEQRVLLTDQGHPVTVPGQGTAAEVEGELFERLIEPKALLPEGANRARDRSLEIEYALDSLDDQTPWTSIRLVEPPAVVRAIAEVTPPAYVEPEGAGAGTVSIDLGAGSDERAVPAPILAGSKMRLVFEFNKGLPAPPPASDPDFAPWTRRTLGPDAATLLSGDAQHSPSATLRPEGDRWTVSWTLEDPVRFSVHAVDEYGIGGTDEAVFRLDALTDKPPTASVTAPVEDKAVLPTASVELTGEARDDVAVAWVALERQLARRPAGSEGGAAEPLGERVEIARRAGAGDSPAAAATGGKRLIAAASLDLTTLELKAGDEVWVTALAADTYELAGRRHEPVRSSVRRLRILSRQEMVEQLWSELAGVRRAAIKLDQDQADAAQLTAKPGEEAAHQGERAQAGISERLARQAEAVGRVKNRLRENGVNDASLDQVVREAGELLRRAGEGSVGAASSLADAAREESQENARAGAGQAERARADRDQRSVRDELGNLIDLLDQGEDTFASKRALERLLEQEKQLRERTAQASRETAGKAPQQLTPQEAQALQKIAQEQRSEAEQLREAVRKMQEREQKLSKNDPAAAQAMAQAARRAEREQVAQKMEQAAQQAQQNQVGAAQQAQGEAIQAMEQMLQDLDQAPANRDEVLRRFLASLIESIDALIQSQKAQARALGDRRASGQFAGLDAGMASLHQNTLGVLDQAAEGPRELVPVAKTLGEAAAAQSDAVIALRAVPVHDAAATEAEGASLEKLEAARKQAEQLDKQAEQRQSGRQREELKKKYEQLLAKQLSIKDSTEGLTGVEPTRRTRAAARLLGEEQAAVKESLSQIRNQTKELGEARVFVFAHRRLDELLGEAVGRLQAGEADTALVRRQASAARVLRSLVDALDDRKKPSDDLRDSQGGGGSGGEPKMVPPAAELALLRSMQQEAAELTRSAGETPGKPDAELLGQATDLQRDLADQAQDLMERLKPKEPASDGPKGKDGGR